MTKHISIAYRCIILLLVMALSGCVRDIPQQASIKSKEEYQQNLLISERNNIFNVYDKNVPNTIILAYEKVYNNTFDITKNYLQYNKVDIYPTYDGFWIWLVKNVWYKYTFDRGDEFGIGKWLIDNRYKDSVYQEIKKNYELLEKMQGVKQNEK